MSFFSAFEVCAELWCMLQATTVECSWDHSMRCVDVSHYYLIRTHWIHFYHILCFVVCRHSEILWFGHTVSYLPSIESWFTFYWPTVLKDKCFWITHTYVPNIIGLHSDRCQYITELLSLCIPMPLFSASVLNVLLLVVRFMYQAWELKRVSVCLPYKNCNYICISSLPLLGILYELSDRSVSRPSPPCNNRDTALLGSFW